MYPYVVSCLGAAQLSHKLKSTYKQSTSRLVSSIRSGHLGPLFVERSSEKWHAMGSAASGGVHSGAHPQYACQLVTELVGHRDGVWEVTASGFPSTSTSPSSATRLLGTASADHTARIWSLDSGLCLYIYAGHSGSVNSIRFKHTSSLPDNFLVLTASGDCSVHVWKIPASISGQATNPGSFFIGGPMVSLHFSSTTFVLKQFSELCEHYSLIYDYLKKSNEKSLIS